MLQQNMGNSLARPGNGEAAKGDSIAVTQTAERTGKAGAPCAAFLTHSTDRAHGHKTDRLGGRQRIEDCLH
jgi:hypothetical protein